jgi:hypothetical protein
MKASWRKGLSGAVSAIVIAVVLVAGLASASYINLTTARYNEAQMQEALRQARLGSELIRIHIHSTDGAVDSPPRITFVNAWGYESRIIQLVVIARNMTPIATIDLRNRPIVLPPGSRMTLEPSQIGLSYPTFKRMADELRSIHAYTEAGNSFGSTWGFPREDNMAGRTVATTYNATTIELWNVPSVTFLNRTWAKFYYTTIGEIPPLQQATIKARNHFEKASVGIGAGDYGWSISLAIDDAVVEGYPAAPVGHGVWFFIDYTLLNWNHYGYASWWWKPETDFATLEGSPVTVEANTYVTILNRPTRFVVVGSNGASYCAASYSLRHVTITPDPGNQWSTPPTTIYRKGMVIEFQYNNWRATRTAFNDMTGHLLVQSNPQYGVVLRAPVPTPTFSYSTTTVTTTMPITMVIGTRTTTLGYTTTTYTSSTVVRTITPELPLTYTASNDPSFIGVVRSMTINNYAANDLSAIYVILPPGNYTVDRYYYVEDVQCNIYVSPPPVAGYGGSVPNEPPPRPPPPPPCVVYLEDKTSGSGSSYQASSSYRYACRR